MLSRGFVVLWLAMLVAMAGIGMVSPLLPVYVREELHGPAVAVALSFSGVSVAQIIASPFVGRLGDRFGVKQFIVMGFFVYGASGLGYLLASNWELVVTLRILSGAGVALIFPMSLAYVGRLAPRDREGTYMGAFAIAQIAGFGIGPLVGGGVRDVFGPDTAFALMALLLAVTGAFVLLLLPRRARPRGAPADYEQPEEAAAPWSELLRRPVVQAAMAVTLVAALAWSASGAFLPVFVISQEGLGTDSATFVGILLGGRALMSAAMQPLFGRLADRMDRNILLSAGLCVSAVGQFLIPSMPRDAVATSLFGNAVTIVPWVLVAYLVVGFAEAAVFPSLSAIFVSIGRTAGMGSIMGVNQMASAIGFLGGSLLGAAVVSTFGISTVFRYSGVMSVLGVLVFLWLSRRGRPRRPGGLFETPEVETAPAR